MNDLKDIIRFLTQIHHTSNCWEWKGSKGRGYGLFSVNGKIGVAHRFSYELFKEQIPQGMELDHLCKNTSCVNPEHLEPVTHKENLMRGNTRARLNLNKSNCPHGHPYDADNTYKRRGMRECRTCIRERMRTIRAKNKP